MKIQCRGDRAEILIYEDIGEGLFGGLSAKAFTDEFKKASGSKHLDLRINSYGGSVFDGVAIYNTIRSAGLPVTVHIDGVAASIASLIAMAGSEIRIAENGWMMIHDPWGALMGNANDMRRQAELLDGIKETLVATYAGRTGAPKDTISGWMTDETWMNADQAVARGFATRVTEHLSVAAWDPVRAARFRNPPAAAINTATRVRAAGMHMSLNKLGVAR